MAKKQTDHFNDLLGSYSFPFKNKEISIQYEAISKLPMSIGEFTISAFSNSIDKKEHIALSYGDIINKENVLTRIHSECFTGDTLRSLRCDCHEQLHASLQRIAKNKHGILIYLRQEGRGIGLINKLKAYMLQDEGLDTMEANIKLGFKADERNYLIAAAILKIFKIPSVHLLTNNPKKIKDLERFGVEVNKRVPIIMEANKYNEKYLKTKKEKGKHLL